MISSMKKPAKWMLMGLVVALALTGGVLAEDYQFATNGNAITITRYLGSNSVVTIPEKINGLPVVSIRNGAFDSSGITSVTIPNSVTSIGGLVGVDLSALTNADAIMKDGKITAFGASVFLPGAFNSCQSLTNITIPTSVASIEGSAFNSCRSLTAITIPNTVTNIGWGAFIYCDSLKSITIPSRVTRIEDNAFSDCTSLTNVTIPSSVTSIGVGAFNSCSSLTMITIPKSVTSISDSAFRNCTSLRAIAVDANNPAYSSVDGVFFNKSQTTLIQCPGGKSGTYILPSSVTNVGDGAFGHCSGLTSITIPKSVTSIEEVAFSACHSLTGIQVDEQNPSYRSVDGVLFNKSQTTLIQCPGGKVFNYTIPNSVINIGRWAFESCSRLTSVTIPNGVANIGEFAFNSCSSLIDIIIPASVTNIEGGAFANCQYLTGVYFEGNAPKLRSVTIDAYKATIYYLEGMKGWGETFGNRPTALWAEKYPPPPSPRR